MTKKRTFDFDVIWLHTGKIGHGRPREYRKQQAVREFRKFVDDWSCNGPYILRLHRPKKIRGGRLRYVRQPNGSVRTIEKRPPIRKRQKFPSLHTVQARQHYIRRIQSQVEKYVYYSHCQEYLEWEQNPARSPELGQARHQCASTLYQLSKDGFTIVETILSDPYDDAEIMVFRRGTLWGVYSLEAYCWEMEKYYKRKRKMHAAKRRTKA